MTDPNGYRWLKGERDPRWTNAKRREVLMAVAECGVRAAETRAEAGRLEDAAVARRLARTKRAVAEARGAADRQVVRWDADHVLSVIPDTVDRVAYERMDSAAAVERSMRLKLERARNRLDECRHRVAEKQARLGRLHATVAERTRAPAVREESDGPAVAVAEKTVDALRLAGRQLTRARDLIARNLTVRDALRVRLADEVRRQAANAAELIAYRAVAHAELTASERRHCRAVAERGRTSRQNATVKRMINAKATALHAHRKSMITDQRQADADDRDGFAAGESDESGGSSAQESDADSLSAAPRAVQQMPLTQWIQNGTMREQMYRGGRKKGNTAAGSPMAENDGDALLSSMSSSAGEFTYPAEKINLFKCGNGGADRSRVSEAVEYVCETLALNDADDVLRFFAAVKRTELRVKKMIAVRKNLYAVARDGLESAAALRADVLNRVPGPLLRLEADTERARRDGLDAQQRRLDEVDEEIGKYARAFNELWFHLESVTKKMQRCQKPVVRKYQLYAEKQTACTEWMMDARSMLDGLCPRQRSDLETPTPPPCGPAPERPDAGGPPVRSVVDWNPAAAACRELAARFHSKVKACMVHVGGHFDADDDSQLLARAYFAYNQQYQWQRARAAGPRRALAAAAQDAADPSANDGGRDAATAGGPITREQTKRRADDIVQYFTTPKDTDDARRTRRPISFRKSRIVIKPPQR